MKNVIKWVAISVGGLFALLLVLGIVLAATGQTEPVAKTEKPSAVSTIKETPSVPANTAKPVEKRTEATKPTVKATPTKTAPVDRTAAFLYVLRKEYPALNNVDDTIIVNAGKNVCSLYKSGYEFEQVAAAVLNAGIPADMAGYLIGASTAAFCPNYNVGDE